MKAIDTNVLVRLLVRDGKRQSEAARRFVEGNAVWLPKTVLLEAEWVLRHAYGFGPAAVAEALTKVCGLAQVTA